MRVTLGDVAENAGVSQATASRVLNGKDGVSHVTRNAVISAARSLGYRRATRGRVIGVVLPELVNPIFATFGHRFATSLAQSGYTPVICSQTVGGISEDEWVEMLLDREMAGLIVVSGAHADVNADLTRYQRLLERHIPLVLVNGHTDEIDAVFVSDDDHEAMRLAVAHLRELGHEQIGLAAGPAHYVPVVRKVEGFKAAVDERKPKVQHSLFSIEGGRAAALKLLDAGVTAIVCASDLMALGAIQACRSRRLAVPKDVSVVGYDDSPMMAFTDPALTTLRQAVPAMCSAALRALLDQLAGRNLPRHEYLFHPELVVRGSTGAVRAR
ncbi:MAG TPA: LacI family DNA-binding transcriptional regulator [Gaiellaceae bacterium]|nr:LacI family DNA-binding transcriptional regulator [Gaiellaceae bacterium]